MYMRACVRACVCVCVHVFVYVCILQRIQGRHNGLMTPLRPWRGILNPLVSVVNITVKDNVYRPTSELVSM